MTQGSATTLTIKLFGPFEARLNGTAIPGLQNREGERLLALLTLNHGRLVPNTSLASILWPETGSLDSLRQSVAHLRHVLGQEGDRLQAPKGSLTINLDGAKVDIIEADNAAALGETASLQRLVSLYRGPLLYGWEDRHPEDRQWVNRERERRRERYREALKVLIKTHIAASDHELAATHLQQYVASSPTDEWAWSQWMDTLARTGQRVAAINLYLKCREIFQHKYNLSPPAEMSRLYQQLRQGEPATALSGDALSVEPIGGAMPLHSPYYIARAADASFESAIARRDSIVLVKGPRQTGKTSLLARGLQQARDMGAHVVFTDFQKLSPDHWTSMGSLYTALVQQIADQLELGVSLQDVWSDRRGVNENFERYLKREVLQKLSAPVVWGLDEVDKLFGYSYSSEVFALFRSWHNERALHPTGPWSRLTLAITYASEAHLFITDLNQSPFNVGTRLTLEDFTYSQVQELNHLYGSPLRNDVEKNGFYALIGGSPYLVRRGLHEMVEQKKDFSMLEVQAGHPEGPFAAHLQRIWHGLSQSAQLVEAVLDLLRGKPCPSPESFFRLRSAGIIVGTEPNDAAFRCRLYQNYLEARLI